MFVEVETKKNCYQIWLRKESNCFVNSCQCPLIKYPGLSNT